MERVKFAVLKEGECFDPGWAHIIEKPYDKFPDRPLGIYMKISLTKALWLRTGSIRDMMPSQWVRRVKIKIEKMK